MGVKYKMSKEMYNLIKYPTYWDSKDKEMKKSKKGMTKKEILQYVNDTFGLKDTVTEIIFC